MYVALTWWIQGESRGSVLENFDGSVWCEGLKGNCEDGSWSNVREVGGFKRAQKQIISDENYHSVFIPDSKLHYPRSTIVDVPHWSSPPINAGILFLQLGEETRRVHLTHELTSLDTLRALIVHMFPQRLTMAMLRYAPLANGTVCVNALIDWPRCFLNWSAELHSRFNQSQGERWKFHFIHRQKSKQDVR